LRVQIKPSAAAQPRVGKQESKINISLFQLPFRQYGAFYKKSDETNRTFKKSTAGFASKLS
jgi:hypothetical protein